MRRRNGFTPLEILQPVPVRNLKSLTTRVHPVRNLKSLTGFTLIELLVVITIMVIMAGLLIPGILRAMKQAKTNRALSEMQHLATVITQVYSEVGYYVRLEDLVQSNNTIVRRWVSTPTNDYINGQSDAEVSTNLLVDPPFNVSGMWNGPYTTYKSYCATVASVSVTPGGLRPIDPWGNSTAENADKLKRQYRMFWITSAGAAGLAGFVPAGANGAMVIISAGGDGVYNCNIPGSKNPSDAVSTDFDNFDPSSNKGDDVYYVFNAGIQ